MHRSQQYHRQPHRYPQLHRQGDAHVLSMGVLVPPVFGMVQMCLPLLVLFHSSVRSF